ncbi:MAG: 5-formyltetrahydrofolate cyclo-ligase [Oscillospiraceae bacterium]|nr:5-formyltetrahydrofolate cyclo-ligase [Oscillospiraceae bacterium]
MDIRQEKNEVRAQCKRWRSRLSPEDKAGLDARIARRVSELWAFREADALFCYVSGAHEVDTRALLAQAWAAGKTVAAPRCVDGTHEMQFLRIEREEDLEPGSFGVLEPKAHCPPVQQTAQSLCIVPGLGFDNSGARLGFGKGYYDRFVASFPGTLVGLCYEGCIRARIPTGRYDQKIPVIITEKRVIRA